MNQSIESIISLGKQLAKYYRKLKEVWLHRDCALWNNHIQMNPTTGELMHVSDACSTYLDIVSRKKKEVFMASPASFFRHVLYVNFLVQLLHVAIEIVKFVIIIPV